MLTINRLLKGYQTDIPVTTKEYIEHKTLQGNESINNIKNTSEFVENVDISFPNLWYMFDETDILKNYGVQQTNYDTISITVTKTDITKHMKCAGSGITNINKNIIQELETDFTISLWSQGSGDIFKVFNTSDYFKLTIETNSITINSVSVPAFITLNVGEYNHIVITCLNQVIIAVYVNGTKFSTNINISSYVFNYEYDKIRLNTQVKYYDLRIFNKTLSDTKITSLYNIGTNIDTIATLGDAGVYHTKITGTFTVSLAGKTSTTVSLWVYCDDVDYDILTFTGFKLGVKDKRFYVETTDKLFSNRKLSSTSAYYFITFVIDNNSDSHILKLFVDNFPGIGKKIKDTFTFDNFTTNDVSSDSSKYIEKLLVYDKHLNDSEILDSYIADVKLKATTNELHSLSYLFSDYSKDIHSSDTYNLYDLHLHSTSNLVDITSYVLKLPEAPYSGYTDHINDLIVWYKFEKTPNGELRNYGKDSTHYGIVNNSGIAKPELIFSDSSTTVDTKFRLLELENNKLDKIHILDTDIKYNGTDDSNITYTVTPTSNINVDILLVGGGGGGGLAGAGGGDTEYIQNFELTVGTEYTFKVGKGGDIGNIGGPSEMTSNLTNLYKVLGGGNGGNLTIKPISSATSGGGLVLTDPLEYHSPLLALGKGFTGGNHYYESNMDGTIINYAGGGGGIASSGEDATVLGSGKGGAGLYYNITTINTEYGKGGDSISISSSTSPPPISISLPATIIKSTATKPSLVKNNINEIYYEFTAKETIQFIQTISTTVFVTNGTNMSEETITFEPHKLYVIDPTILEITDKDHTSTNIVPNLVIGATSAITGESTEYTSSTIIIKFSRLTTYQYGKGGNLNTSGNSGAIIIRYNYYDQTANSERVIVQKTGYLNPYSYVWRGNATQPVDNSYISINNPTSILNNQFLSINFWLERDITTISKDYIFAITERNPYNELLGIGLDSSNLFVNILGSSNITHITSTDTHCHYSIEIDYSTNTYAVYTTTIADQDRLDTDTTVSTNTLVASTSFIPTIIFESSNLYSTEIKVTIGDIFDDNIVDYELSPHGIEDFRIYNKTLTTAIDSATTKYHTLFMTGYKAYSETGVITDVNKTVNIDLEFYNLDVTDGGILKNFGNRTSEFNALIHNSIYSHQSIITNRLIGDETTDVLQGKYGFEWNKIDTPVFAQNYYEDQNIVLEISYLKIISDYSISFDLTLKADITTYPVAIINKNNELVVRMVQPLLHVNATTIVIAYFIDKVKYFKELTIDALVIDTKKSFNIVINKDTNDVSFKVDDGVSITANIVDDLKVWYQFENDKAVKNYSTSSYSNLELNVESNIGFISSLSSDIDVDYAAPYTYYTFLPGVHSFKIENEMNCEMLMVGGGGNSTYNIFTSAGGGGGEVKLYNELTLLPGDYTVNVGEGGYNTILSSNSVVIYEALSGNLKNGGKGTLDYNANTAISHGFQGGDGYYHEYYDIVNNISKDDYSLIAHYKFNGDFTDSSGCNNHLQQTLGSISTSATNVIIGTESLKSDNTQNYELSLPHENFNLCNTDLTISFWFNISEYITQDSVPLFEFTSDKTTTDNPLYRVKLLKYPDNFQIIVNSLTDSEDISTGYYYNGIGDGEKVEHGLVKGPVFELNKWYLHTYTITETGGMKQYLNGYQLNHFQFFDGGKDYWFKDNPSKMCINYQTNTFLGNLDDFRIYNKALTAQQISLLYKTAMIPNYGGGGGGIGSIGESATSLSGGKGGIGIYYSFNSYGISYEYGAGGNAIGTQTSISMSDFKINSDNTKIETNSYIYTSGIGVFNFHIMSLSTGRNIIYPLPITFLETKTIIACSINFFHALFLDNLGNVYGGGPDYCITKPIPSESTPNLGVEPKSGSIVYKCGFGASKNLTRLPIRINALDNAKITKISAGNLHSLFLDDNHHVYSCGYGDFGVLGHENEYDCNLPTLINKLEGLNIIGISAGANHSLFLDDNCNVYSCGYGGFGELGHGNEYNCNLPTLINELVGSNIINIYAGAYNSLFLGNDNTVYSCGFGHQGKLGHGNEYDCNLPTLINELEGLNIIGIAAGANHSLFLDNNCNVYSCGYGDYGKLGHGNEYNCNLPTLINELVNSNITSISTGFHHSLFLGNDSKVYSCGFGGFGTFGDGTTDNKNIPTLNEILEGSNITSINAGFLTSIFLSEPKFFINDKTPLYPNYGLYTVLPWHQQQLTAIKDIVSFKVWNETTQKYELPATDFVFDKELMDMSKTPNYTGLYTFADKDDAYYFYSFKYLDTIPFEIFEYKLRATSDNSAYIFEKSHDRKAYIEGINIDITIYTDDIVKFINESGGHSLVIKNSTGANLVTQTSGSTITEYKFSIAGDYSYICQYHSVMTGKITVDTRPIDSYDNTLGQTAYQLDIKRNVNADILIVGGGGGGGGAGDRMGGGGGGAGGVVYITDYKMNGVYKIKVGSGGTNSSNILFDESSSVHITGYNGNNSGIYNHNDMLVNYSYLTDNFDLIGKGGGGGAFVGSTYTYQPNSGGSSGGIGSKYDSMFFASNESQATQGNTYWNGNNFVFGGYSGGMIGYSGSGGGGGGGIGGAGAPTSSTTVSGSSDGGGGGIGIVNNITGEAKGYAGGGGGSTNSDYNGIEGTGGYVVINGKTTTIGGNGLASGTDTTNNPDGNGLKNTGSGGGGGWDSNTLSGSGSSGIVIIRFSKSNVENVLTKFGRGANAGQLAAPGLLVLKTDNNQILTTETTKHPKLPYAYVWSGTTNSAINQVLVKSTDDFIIPNNLVLTFWYYESVNDDEKKEIIKITDAPNTNIEVFSTTTEFVFSVGNSTVNIPRPNKYEWNFYGLIFDGTYASVYVNDMLVKTETVTIAPTGTGKITLGISTVGVAKIADYRIYESSNLANISEQYSSLGNVGVLDVFGNHLTEYDIKDNKVGKGYLSLNQNNIKTKIFNNSDNVIIRYKFQGIEVDKYYPIIQFTDYINGIIAPKVEITMKTNKLFVSVIIDNHLVEKEYAIDCTTFKAYSVTINADKTILVSQNGSTLPHTPGELIALYSFENTDTTNYQNVVNLVGESILSHMTICNIELSTKVVSGTTEQTAINIVANGDNYDYYEIKESGTLTFAKETRVDMVLVGGGAGGGVGTVGETEYYGEPGKVNVISTYLKGTYQIDVGSGGEVNMPGSKSIIVNTNTGLEVYSANGGLTNVEYIDATYSNVYSTYNFGNGEKKFSGYGINIQHVDISISDPEVIIHNLLGLYKFDGDLYDSSGNNNTLEPTGTITFASNIKMIGSSAYLGSVYSSGVFFRVPINPYYTCYENGITISGWFNLQSDTAFAAGIIELNGDSENRITLAKNQGNNLYILKMKNNAYTFNSLPTNLLFFGEAWRHLVFIIDSDGNCKLFLDNSKIYTGTSYNIEPNYNNIYIGNTLAHTTQYVKGYIDNLHIYNKALSATEVSNLYNHQTLVHSILVPDDSRYKTLTFEYNPNDLIFTFREDASPYSWQEAYNQAIANGKRMPTKTELLNYLSSLGYTLQAGDTKTPLYNEDIWIAVVAPEYSNGRDYIHIGNNVAHFVGKSHTENDGYPTWATETTDAVKKQYCEVSEQTEYTVNFPQETECDILIVGGGGGGGGSVQYSRGSGGGGAGEYELNTGITLNAGTTYIIRVGKGGSGGNGDTTTIEGLSGDNGNSSIIYEGSTVIYEAIGGGGGGGGKEGTGVNGLGGACGGGATFQGSVGVATTGYNGGVGDGNYFGGGGGGMGSIGLSATILGGGNGGNGVIMDLTGVNIEVCGGGGGGGFTSDYDGKSKGGGGDGVYGGGDGGGYGTFTDGTAYAGIDANSYGGGGGAATIGISGSGNKNGGTGGSGIVIIRYKTRKQVSEVLYPGSGGKTELTGSSGILALREYRPLEPQYSITRTTGYNLPYSYQWSGMTNEHSDKNYLYSTVSSTTFLNTDFIISLWCYLNNTENISLLSISNILEVYVNNHELVFELSDGKTTTIIKRDNKWQSFLFVRSNGLLEIYVNNVNKSKLIAKPSVDIVDTRTTLYINKSSTIMDNFINPMKISDLRIYRNSSKYIIDKLANLPKDQYCYIGANQITDIATAILSEFKINNVGTTPLTQERVSYHPVTLSSEFNNREIIQEEQEVTINTVIGNQSLTAYEWSDLKGSDSLKLSNLYMSVNNSENLVNKFYNGFEFSTTYWCKFSSDTNDYEIKLASTDHTILELKHNSNLLEASFNVTNNDNEIITTTLDQTLDKNHWYLIGITAGISDKYVSLSLAAYDLNFDGSKNSYISSSALVPQVSDYNYNINNNVDNEFKINAKEYGDVKYYNRFITLVDIYKILTNDPPNSETLDLIVTTVTPVTINLMDSVTHQINTVTGVESTISIDMHKYYRMHMSFAFSKNDLEFSSTVSDLIIRSDTKTYLKFGGGPQPTLKLYSDTEEEIITTTHTPLSSNVWYEFYVTMKYDGQNTTGEIYIGKDNSIEYSMNYSKPDFIPFKDIDNTLEVRVGVNQDEQPTKLNKKIENINIFTKKLNRYTVNNLITNNSIAIIPSIIKTDKLELWYRLNDFTKNIFNGVIKDSSGKDRHGTIIGTHPTQEVTNINTSNKLLKNNFKAMKITNNSFNIATPRIILNNNFTIMIKVKLGLTEFNHNIFTYNDLRLNISSLKLTLIYGSTSIKTIYNPFNDKWYSIILIYNKNKTALSVYINKELKAKYNNVSIDNLTNILKLSDYSTEDPVENITLTIEDLRILSNVVKYQTIYEYANSINIT
jgi:alpha-tubulin suppressor-like RCC1 family protein